jgi:hypothetical protein
MNRLMHAVALVGATWTLSGCGESAVPIAEKQATPTPQAIERAAPVPAPPAAPEKQAYFGDLHMHTALSFDAFITGTRTLPEDAYRYAKGEAIDHVSGEKIKLAVPLDFLAVTDHSEMIGVAWAMNDANDPLSKLPIAARITSTDFATSQQAFTDIVRSAATGSSGGLFDPALATAAVQSGWQRLIAAAEAANDPGRFTTFVGYEWSSMPNYANLHRNVIFRGSKVPPLPFSSLQSNRPEDLWAFLERWRTEGDDVLAIPHNSNASKGLMFALEKSDGQPIDAAYAEARVRNEPLVEVTQFKGTSETHTALAPNDEFADFELWNTVVGAPTPVDPVPGSYVRNAYGRGLAIEETVGVNPFKFGLVGASDSHDSSSAVDENNFSGGHGNADGTPQTRLHSQASTLVTSSLRFSAAGLTGVWAEANTREAIFDALRRKETFATTGPRIRVRFFAGDGLPDDLVSRTDADTLARANGVPMGGDLVTDAATSPVFFVQALRDPNSGALARVQIVKVWAADGREHDAIFDVACSDGATPDSVTHRCPDNGATVDLATCAPSADRGAAELAATWRDPTFVAGQRAAYYARAIENPTCRWSTWDAIRLGEAPPADAPATIRERAFSSPIWVAAKG